jgi:hypothetical protein
VNIFDIPNNDDADLDVDNIIEEYGEDFDFNRIHTNVDEEEMVTMIEDKDIIDDKVINVIFVFFQ